MTNYNDGKWHGWNGGECPVHPETVVDCVYLDGEIRSRDAEDIRWSAGESLRPIAFRVIKEHKEPREFWLVDGVLIYTDYDHCMRSTGANDKIIHVREVL